MNFTPLELTEKLGLQDGFGRCLSAKDIEDFAARRCAYDWVHFGMRDISVNHLLNVLRSSGSLLAPRSGHIGNWGGILKGAAGALDFNHAICSQQYGYPLIYCFNQTENYDLSAGDHVYLPGSIIENNERHCLPLLTWDGKRYREMGREEPLFVPFVRTHYQGETLPLITLHWNRLRKRSALPFRLEAALLYQHRDAVRSMLEVLLKEAVKSNSPRRAFTDIVGHAVSLDGHVDRCEIEPEGKGFRLQHTYYQDIDHLIEAILQPIRAVADPEAFFEDIDKMPAELPVISNLLTAVLSAIFGTHYPDANVNRATMTQPFNPHIHWGARDMAGYPPVRRGYIAQKSTARTMRNLMTPLVNHFDEVDPLYMMMLPASIFMLCPPGHSPADSDVLSSLFLATRKITSRYRPDDSRIVSETVEMTRRWLEGEGKNLSHYMRSRFYGKPGVLGGRSIEHETSPIMPEFFGELTIREACLIVGALVEASLQTAHKAVEYV
ncbi:DUF6025 family protein [Kosakonia sacchari]|uniref:DUF6025 family protein n=1 Tax=Kosakonia sacchari TaxID=1158459 RepID=UPI0032D8EBB1